MIIEKNKKLLKFFYEYTGNYIYLLLFISFATGILDSLGITMFFPLLELLINDNNDSNSSFLSQYISNGLAFIGLTFTLSNVMFVFFFFFIAKAGALMLASYLKSSIRIKFLSTIRLTLIGSLGRFSYRDFTRMDTMTLSTSFTTEAGQANTAFEKYLDSGYKLVMVLTYLMITIMLDFQTAIVVLLLFAPIGLFYYLINRRTKKISVQFKDTSRLLLKGMTESVMFFKYLKATGLFSNFNERLQIVVANLAKLIFKMDLLKGIVSSSKDLLIISSLATIVFIHHYLLGGQLQTLGLIMVIFYRGFGDLLQFQNNWQAYLAASGGLYGLKDTLEILKKGGESNTGKMLGDSIQEINLISVAYQVNGKYLVKDIDINIKRGQVIALVGESGAGKTTLANLVIGLLKATEGRILINGEAIEVYHPISLYMRFGYITQEPVVFSGTFYENITFRATKDEKTISKFWKACERANLTDLVQQLPDGEDTLIGDFGSTLSGGQKQRLSIARELYREPEILILDEATSALDSANEEAIQGNIHSLAASGMTMIIIAHRLSTIKHADLICILDAGQLKETGTYQNLANHSPRFQALLQKQGILKKA